MPRITTTFSLIGSSPARSAASAARTGSNPKSRRAMLHDAIGAQAVDAHVDAIESRVAQPLAISGKRTPFVESAMS